MKLHAILTATKAVLAALGLRRAEVAVAAADAVATGIEEIVKAVKVHAADGKTVAFLSAPDMPAQVFKQYADALRAAFEKDRDATGVHMPRLVLLPPGVTMETVKETAAQLEHAAQYLATNGSKA
jgi:hypothetical protein